MSICSESVDSKTIARAKPMLPRMMPWGWRHAYLNDPDGHEISIYWAGEMRMEKTVMKAAKAVERAPVATKAR